MLINVKFLKVENFKSIFFHSKQLNYTFELNYNDLFLYRNEFYYFLIYFKVNLGDTRWFLGQIFLKKYLIVFDQEKAFLGFIIIIIIIKIIIYHILKFFQFY